MKVTKAIIPAAGLGTRVLPASKSIPKEMLPIVDKPAIQYIVEEAVRQDDGRVRDDMSVVVAAIWERTRENACVPSYKNRQIRLS